jgi:TonB family protein
MAVAVYHLKSELARVCLPAPAKKASRRLAWANSISFLFLLIGAVGAQSRLPNQRILPPLEQPAPIIVEPLPQVSPPADAKPTEQQTDDTKTETPHIQTVTIDTPAINFSVPTPGSLLVPLAAAMAPAEIAMKQSAPVVKHEAPVGIESTGSGGERPAPPYPLGAKLQDRQGTVTFLVTVDDTGKVTSVDIQESSGSPTLDEPAQRWIKSHWIIPPGNGGHVFRAPIHFVLR